MAMTNKITFSKLARLLDGMDFGRATEPTHVLFEHPATKSIVVLRRYRPREAVSTADLITVRKTLDERGLMPAESFEDFLQKMPA
jgi:hypothetical protein